MPVFSLLQIILQIHWFLFSITILWQVCRLRRPHFRISVLRFEKAKQKKNKPTKQKILETQFHLRKERPRQNITRQKTHTNLPSPPAVLVCSYVPYARPHCAQSSVCAVGLHSRLRGCDWGSAADMRPQTLCPRRGATTLAEAGGRVAAGSRCCRRDTESRCSEQLLPPPPLCPHCHTHKNTFTNTHSHPRSQTLFFPLMTKLSTLLVTLCRVLQ